jgi:transcriptional regulator with XRE-family HTH domain
MGRRARVLVTYDIRRLAEDMAAKGWDQTDLARESGVSVATVSRFFSGEYQTAPTAKRLGLALGYSVRRYIVTSLAVSA